ncbi:AMP-dependent synthetase and ligase [Fibrisoma limi BUZ 3]|uniref:AMP-dependent synthetase and ligase n=1 Tax=Fibrisoma limi BUZ 3 TaxID=1185876 RepID=I2GK28_9BACT|nr:feruloyl-CoA synthase [Fibrisoma limi]CCH54253.1 AMP-dependent synthetase and ligase [Fibrisoma limi BUZ 3]
MKFPCKTVAFGPVKTKMYHETDGTIRLRADEPLAPYPEKMTEKLRFWADRQPDTTFLARRNARGEWVHLSYGQALRQVQSLAQCLLNQGLTVDDTIVILSENSLEHALLALAAMYVGIPYAPVSPQYSLGSNGFERLTYCLQLMTPRLVFAQNGQLYEQALALAKSLLPDVIILTAEPTGNTNFEELLQTEPTAAVEEAYQRVGADTVAKILFTSGSTGVPKGVINTHGMWSANQQQILQAFPFLATQPQVLLDWLPWNHTFGGNYNFGLVLYNGGTLYIDDGKPTPLGIETTVQNLRDVSPTMYFNVPKGFEMLIPYFERDWALQTTFFSRLNLLFYAGASLSQPVWDRWEELTIEATGQIIPIVTGFGSTESSPLAIIANRTDSFAGLLGVPVAGLDLKLVPDSNKLEARYKAPNITPGYWRDEIATSSAYDEEGYYKTGDAVRFLDENDPDKGLIFDGRIAEDFKLSTGTWVNVGMLREKIIAVGSPLVQDAVMVGLNRDYVSAILFFNPDACRELAGLSDDVSTRDAFLAPAVTEFTVQLLKQVNQTARGSADRLEVAVVALEPPAADRGEITDKGSLNQRAILHNRPHLVGMLYPENGWLTAADAQNTVAVTTANALS